MRSRQPGEYRLSLGDSVFLHGQAHVILAMAGELVELSDPQYPLLTVSYPQEQFIRLLGQDKRNDRLLAPEQRNDLAIHTADLLPEQVSPALDGPALPGTPLCPFPWTILGRIEFLYPIPICKTAISWLIRIWNSYSIWKTRPFLPAPFSRMGSAYIFDLENKALSARTFQQDGIGLYQTVENQQGEVDNPDLERQLNSFARQWFANIQSQDYRRQRMHVRYHEGIGMATSPMVIGLPPSVDTPKSTAFYIPWAMVP